MAQYLLTFFPFLYIHINHYYGYQVKEGEISEHVARMGEMKNAYNI